MKESVIRRREFIRLIGGAGAALFVPRLARSADPDFTLVQVPDLHRNNGATNAQKISDWIVANRVAWNIQGAFSTGDYAGSETDDATKSFFIGDCWTRLWSVMDGLGLPWITAIGNHDWDDDSPSGRDSHTCFDPQVGYDRISGKPWGPVDAFSGVGNDVGLWAAANCTASEAIRFAVGSHKFLVIALETFPRAAAVSWATSLMDVYPDHYVILLTHGLIQATGALIADGYVFGPNAYSLPHGTPGPDNYSGVDLWPVISAKSNLLMAWCGHDVLDAAHRHAHPYANRPYAQFSNYQQEAGGGDGWIALYKFRPSIGKIEVTQYKTNNPEGPDTTYWPMYQLDYAPPPPRVTTTSLADGTVGVAYSKVLTAADGTLPYTWSVAAGTLPPGLSLNGGTGEISGTPTAAGTFNFTAQVTDASSGIATAGLRIVVNGPALTRIPGRLKALGHAKTGP